MSADSQVRPRRGNAVVGMVRSALQGGSEARKTRLERAHSIDDLRRLARRRLPRAVYDYMDGAAEDEVTMRRNRDAFGAWTLVPRVLRDVSAIDTTTTVAGTAVDSPVICAPTGFTRLFHPDGETAVARAAHEAGSIYCLSTMATRSIEDVADASKGPKWFQLYVWRDEALVDELVERADAAGYGALCLTVDTAVLGRRERDLRNGLTIPPRAGLRTVLDGARRPQWWWGFIRSDELIFANVVSRAPEGTGAEGLAVFTNRQFDPSVTWESAARIAARWPRTFAVKGIQCAEDAVRAVEIGASVVIVSNHGGRQLDNARGALEVLPEVVEAVGGSAEVVLDGGVRRGTDVVKALALGARAVMIGRAYLYGLAAGGEAGVARALSLLDTELRTALGLVGVSAVADLGRQHVAAAAPIST